MANLFSYSVQIAILLAAGGITLRLLNLQTPAWRLWCWQLLLAVCLILPFIQSWRPPASDVSISFTADVNSAAGPSAAKAFEVPWAAGLAAILLAGVLFRLGMFALGFARLRAYRRRSQLHPEAALELRQRLNVGAEIRTSDEVPGPVTFGIRPPVILLPTRWIENQSVLFHELIHVRRHDWLYMAAEEFIRAVMWFHPLVWWAIAQIQLAREQVVDREVIQLTQSREQYLETLLAIAAARSGLDLAPAPLFLRKRHLRSRVASLLKEVPMSRIRLHFSLAGFAALTLAAGWLAVRSFPLEAAQASQDGKLHPVTIEVRVHDKGVVDVSVELDKDGNLLNATAVDGPEELQPDALNAVRIWKYRWLPSGLLTIDTSQGETDGITAKIGEKHIKVGGNVQATNLVKKVNPVYPVDAKTAKIQGKVTLTVTISKEGKVENIQVASGDPILAAAAVEAVRQWEYRPTLLNGDPVAVLTQVDVNFTLAP
jgi:TonB family protein